MGTPALFVLVMLFASNSFGSTPCAQLKQELKAMQKAQQQILLSLVNNHETFAASLEEYSSAVSNAGTTSARIASARMNESAEAFRNRGLRGKKMALKLNKATGDLIARVALCLNR